MVRLLKSASSSRELHNHWTGIYKIPRIPHPLCRSLSASRWHPQCLPWFRLRTQGIERTQSTF